MTYIKHYLVVLLLALLPVVGAVVCDLLPPYTKPNYPRGHVSKTPPTKWRLGVPPYGGHPPPPAARGPPYPSP